MYDRDSDGLARNAFTLPLRPSLLRRPTVRLLSRLRARHRRRRQPPSRQPPHPCDCERDTDRPGGVPGLRVVAVYEAAIARHLDALQEIADANGGERAAGTSGYEASVDYVAEQLEEMGYEVTLDPSTSRRSASQSPVTVEIGDESWTSPSWVHAQIYSPGGEVTAPVEGIGIAADGSPTGINGCNQADWSEFTSGNIALVYGGGCRRRDVLLLAQDAGASGLVSMYGASRERGPPADARRSRRAAHTFARRGQRARRGPDRGRTVGRGGPPLTFRSR